MKDSERLLKVMEYLGFRNNQSSFARSINYSADSVNKVLKDKGNISKKFANAITTKYPNINEEFLLIGRGEMTDENENISETDINSLYKKILEDKNIIIEQQKELINQLRKSMETTINLANSQEEFIVKKVMIKMEEFLKNRIELLNKEFERVKKFLEEKVEAYESESYDKVKKPSKLSEKAKEQKTK